MLDKIKTISDYSIYPEWFKDLLKWMDTHNYSNTQFAKKYHVNRIALNKYLDYPETLPLPDIYRAALEVLPEIDKSLLDYIKKGKTATNKK